MWEMQLFIVMNIVKGLLISQIPQENYYIRMNVASVYTIPRLYGLQPLKSHWNRLPL